MLWWTYPLVGPGPERLLVLAADADGLRRDRADGGAATATVERIAPGFALHTDFPGADELARRLPEILPSTSVGESARIVAQVLELGYPVLEFSQNDRVPVTPDWACPGGADRRARRERAARALAAGEPVPDDLRDVAPDRRVLQVLGVRGHVPQVVRHRLAGRQGPARPAPRRARRSARRGTPQSGVTGTRSFWLNSRTG
ncbi:hypothetical protein TPA0906_12790 [Streptomyces olivaceus]|nr:hypothetical protein TPA0906_12790 [Streptomyces olivaceus]